MPSRSMPPPPGPTVVCTPRSPREGRKARGRRALDLLIAATALAAELPLYTRNPSDFDGLGALVDVTAVRAGASSD